MEWVIPAAIVLLLVWLVMTYRRAVGLREVAVQAWSELDGEFRRRHDLVPGLVDVVKSLVPRERKAADALSAARKLAATRQSPPEIAKGEAALSAAIEQLLGLADSRPELKADARFRRLNSELSGLRLRLEASQLSFNEAAQDYNDARRTVAAALVNLAKPLEPLEYCASRSDNQRFTRR